MFDPMFFLYFANNHRHQLELNLQNFDQFHTERVHVQHVNPYEKI
jgi:hypothetical protein